MGVYRIYPQKRRNPFGFLRGLSVNTNLIIINVIALFVFLILLYSNILSINDIALNPSNVLQGKYLWAFLTSMFMHGGFLHLLANMFSLFFIGGLVERVLGSKRYLWFYLIAGLFAGLFFILWTYFFNGDLNTYAVGASGALFGVAGLLVLLTPNLPVYVMLIPIPIKMKYAIPGILIILWLISAAPMAFGGQRIPIGNTAHLGGLIAGLVYGVYLRRKFPKKVQWISNHFS